MTNIWADGYISDNQRTEGEVKVVLEDIRELFVEALGGAARTTLTIASGSVTPTIGTHAVDTEGAASTDDLTNIAQTNTPDGRLLLITAANTARTVVVKHAAGGTGEIQMVSAADFSMDEIDMWLVLQRVGTVWKEVLRSYG